MSYTQLAALLKKGADPNERIGAKGGTYLHAAVHDMIADERDGKRVDDILDLLMNAGADVNLRSKRGESPLFSAVSMAKVHPSATAKVVKALLARGADPNIAEPGANAPSGWDRYDGFGRAPLHVVCELGNVAIVSILLASGARADAKDYRGETPREYTKNGRIRALLDGRTVPAKSTVPIMPAALALFFREGRKRYSKAHIRGLPGYVADDAIALRFFVKPSTKLLTDNDVDLDTCRHLIPFAAVVDEPRLFLVDASKPDECPVVLWDEGEFVPVATSLAAFLDQLV